MSMEEPKKPVNAYWIWLSDNRAAIQKEVGEGSISAVGKAAGEKWKGLPAAQKAPYEKKAAESKTAYEKAMEEFKAQGGVAGGRRKEKADAKKELMEKREKKRARQERDAEGQCRAGQLAGMGATCGARSKAVSEDAPLDTSASEKMLELLAKIQNLRLQPKTIGARDGSKVRIRVATLDDEKHLPDIMDTVGVGAGHSGDPILRNVYQSFIGDPEMITLWAEDAEAPHANLGMIAVTLPTHRESFIHSLRVGIAARGKGVAELLVKECCKACMHLQGPDSVGRWGVVSANDIMVNWSKRKQLHGPGGMTRYVAKPAAPSDAQKVSDVLPSGWTFRHATEADAALIHRHWTGETGAFDPICRDFAGGVNIMRYGSFARLNEDLVLKLCRGHTLPPNNPHMDCGMSSVVLFDQDQKLVGWSVFAKCPNHLDPASGNIVLYSFVSGTRVGMKAIMEAIRVEAAQVEKCLLLLGYVQDVDWIHEMLADSPFKRGSDTLELLFDWPNKQFCS